MSSATVVVGASIAGLSVVEGLRDRGHRGAITLVGGELHLPYSRPALSKQVLTGGWSAEQAALTDLERLTALDVTVLTGVRARRLDLAAKCIAIGPDDRVLPFGTLVIATGVEPRTLAAVPQAMTVRTIDDVLDLRDRFQQGRRIVIIGAGVLGCELAAGAREAGLEVQLLARGPSLRLGGMGSFVGDRVAAMLRDRGVTLRFGTEVVSAVTEPDGRVTLALDDGTRTEADLVVAAVGADPAIGWLRSSGLDLSDGVVCDETGRAAPGVYAVGDVAAWWDPAAGRPVRIEHQTDAIEQAQIVADVLTGGSPDLTRHTFFWTELFGTRVQALGRVDTDDVPRIIAGDLSDDRFVAAFGPDGATTGIVGWNMAREFRLARAQVVDRDIHSLTKGSASA